MVKHTQIRWVKNIKREHGSSWAYMEQEFSQEFQLNFSETQKKGAALIQVDEIILLFQRVDHIPGVTNATYLTHLVTPLDDVLFYNSTNQLFPYERRVAVVARAQPNTAVVSSPDILNFFKPNWGKICAIELLHDGWSRDQIALTIWNLFAGYFNPYFDEYQILTKEAIEIIELDLFSAVEGKERIIIRRHLSRERSPAIIKLAKLRALQMNNGVLRCECCRFVFSEMYGIIGNDFIECHHRQPISQGGERVTNIPDLALVCSNCHRMLHKRNERGNYCSVEELKSVIELHPGLI